MADIKSIMIFNMLYAGFITWFFYKFSDLSYNSDYKNFILVQAYYMCKNIILICIRLYLNIIITIRYNL